MILKRQVTLKALVTPTLKENLLEEVRAAISQVEQAQDELERQTRRMMLELQRTDLNRAMAFRQQVDAEKRKQEELKANLLAQREEIQTLEMGQEVTRGSLEGQIEVQVGDRLLEMLGTAEILLEDDVVKEIRDPAARS
jgi:hypothetical protein